MMKSINNTNLHNTIINEEEYVKLPDMLQTIQNTLKIYQDEQNNKFIEQQNEININQKKNDIILDKIIVLCKFVLSIDFIIYYIINCKYFYFLDEYNSSLSSSFSITLIFDLICDRRLRMIEIFTLIAFLIGGKLLSIYN